MEREMEGEEMEQEELHQPATDDDDQQEDAGAERPRRSLGWLLGPVVMLVGVAIFALATNSRLGRLSDRLADIDRKVAAVDSARTATQKSLDATDEWVARVRAARIEADSTLKANLAIEQEARQKIDGDLNRRLTMLEGKGGRTATKAPAKKAVRKTRPAAQKSRTAVPSAPKPLAMTAEDVKKIATEAAMVAVDTLLARRLEPVNVSLRAMASALAEIGSREVITGIITAKKGKKVVAVKSDCLLSPEAVQALRDIK